jgi:hypothetical protein
MAGPHAFTSSTLSDPAQQTSKILLLSAELRKIIYTYFMPMKDELPIMASPNADRNRTYHPWDYTNSRDQYSTLPVFALLQTCRLIRYEIAPEFFDRANMGFLWPSPALVRLQGAAFPDTTFDIKNMTLYMPLDVEIDPQDLDEIDWKEIFRCLPRLQKISLRPFICDGNTRRNSTRLRIHALSLIVNIVTMSDCVGRWHNIYSKNDLAGMLVLSANPLVVGARKVDHLAECWKWENARRQQRKRSMSF